MGLKRFLKKNIYNFKFFKKKKNILENRKILITGASSGIGLGICEKLIKKNKIFAVYNSSFNSLSKILNPNLCCIKCDLMNLNNYQEIEKQIKNNEIDLIINCAGQYGSSNQSIKNIDFDNFLNILKLNSLSILKILQLFIENDKIKHLKKIINISSKGGSIELNDKGNAYIYRSTKSALNSISKNLSIDLNNNFGTSVITIDPGNVQTGMNKKGYLSKEKCAEYIVDVISENKNFNGKFINLLKYQIPW